MNNRINNVLFVGGMILLFAACGQFKTASPPPSAELPAPDITGSSTSIPDPAGNLPTVVLPNNSDSAQLRKYIGLTYPPLPEGISDSFGMLIQDKEDHALTLVSDATNKMLWLNKMTHHDSSGTAYWQVKDILDLSALESGLLLIPDGCLLNGVPDSEIIAAGKDGKIESAWRANTTLDRFEAMPINGIECHSDKVMDL